MFGLPVTITVGGCEYPIRCRGDYRMVLDCFNALNDISMDEQYRVFTALIIFYDNMTSIEDVVEAFGDNLQEAIKKMYDFYNCNQKNIGSQQNYKLVDWDSDSQMIASAINNVARTEIRAVEYCHWWTFMGYYLAIGDCALSTVVGIRHKLKTGGKLEDYEKKFRKENPEYFIWDSDTIEQKQAEDYIRNLWNKNKEE